MQGTTEDLFKWATAAEKEAQAFYLGLSKKFSHVPEVANFWQEMAEEERLHAEGLEEIFSSLTPQQQEAPADPDTLWKAQELSQFSAFRTLQRVKTLEDAYEITHELEYSEVNTVFEFILTEFVDDETQREFVITQLREHMARLLDSPTILHSSGWRRSIEAQDV